MWAQSPFEISEISDFVSCLCDKLITFLITFYPKEEMSCKLSDLECYFICSTRNGEYIGESGDGKTKVSDKVRVYRQDRQQ